MGAGYLSSRPCIIDFVIFRHLQHKYTSTAPMPPSLPRKPFITHPFQLANHLTHRTLTMSAINRNPHRNFKQVESSRPDWQDKPVKFIKTADPDWKYGSGANKLHSSSTSHVSIDPHEQGRPAGLNYKLLISAITPRPIAFLSTRSADGRSENIAPFSYFNMVAHDPPRFIVSFACSVAEAKDSLRNLIDTKECVINIISEPWIEAANSASIDAPFGASEWDVSGLTPDYSCQTVKCPRVKEAVFSVEAKLDEVKEYESRSQPGKVTTTMVILEGTRMWAREDAIDKDRSMIDLDVSRIPLHSACADQARCCDLFRVSVAFLMAGRLRCSSCLDQSLRMILEARKGSRSCKSSWLLGSSLSPGGLSPDENGARKTISVPGAAVLYIQ